MRTDGGVGVDDFGGDNFEFDLDMNADADADVDLDLVDVHAVGSDCTLDMMDEAT